MEWRGVGDPEYFIVGRYWFEQNPQHPSVHGHRLCLFNTRREAREWAGSKSYGKYRVVKVKVAYKVCGR